MRRVTVYRHTYWGSMDWAVSINVAGRSVATGVCPSLVKAMEAAAALFGVKVDLSPIAAKMALASGTLPAAISIVIDDEGNGDQQPVAEIRLLSASIARIHSCDLPALLFAVVQLLAEGDEYLWQ